MAIVKSSISTAPAHRSTHDLLCASHEAESWQVENKYLVKHYRKASHSYRSSLASLGYLHNQTSNIYTHLIGALLVLAWAGQTYNDVLLRYPTADANDRLIFGVYFGSAFFCFGSSAAYHLFSDHSGPVSQIWLRFDLYGVFAIFSGTVVSGTYYSFYCDGSWWRTYTYGVYFLTFLGAAVCSKPRFSRKIWRNVRAMVFVSIGFFGIFPIFHMAEKYGRAKADEMFGWNLMCWEGICLFSGTLMYGYRIPERLKPGFFDIWGASHQIFHVSAVITAALHYRALLQAFDYNHSHVPVSQQC